MAASLQSKLHLWCVPWEHLRAEDELGHCLPINYLHHSLLMYQTSQKYFTYDPFDKVESMEQIYIMKI